LVWSKVKDHVAYGSGSILYVLGTHFISADKYIFIIRSLVQSVKKLVCIRCQTRVSSRVGAGCDHTG